MKLPVVSSSDLVSFLLGIGFEYAPKRGKGSHIALYKIDKSGSVSLVIIPRVKSIPIGTLRGILKQAGLSRDDFINSWKEYHKYK